MKTYLRRRCKKDPSVWTTDAVKATVVDFYCSDIFSLIIPSMKDKCIIREERGCKARDENGDTVKLQRYYLMYNLSEASEMFVRNIQKQR